LLDTQSVHAAAGVPAATTGRDAAKKVPGHKRGLAVDVLGLVIWWNHRAGGPPAVETFHLGEVRSLLERDYAAGTRH
jgi:hypothetical protein